MSLFNILFQDDIILEVFDVLQRKGTLILSLYWWFLDDPVVPKHLRIDHKEYLTNKKPFKQVSAESRRTSLMVLQVIPFQDEELVAKIHQTYRIQFVIFCCWATDWVST